MTETIGADLSDEQKRYLEGFMSGVRIGRLGPQAPVAAAATAEPEPVGPDAAAFKAQDRFVRDGKKLADQEKFKRELNPLDAYERLKEQARNNAAPTPADNFRWRWYGLFYVAPAQDSYMCRLRMPNGILKSHQLAGLADLAETYGGGYAHVTTRANIQIREIAPQKRGDDGRGHPGPRPVLARLRRRQHPQRHGHADGRHRPDRADGYPALRARVALPHPERPLALRPAAQVQRRLRRRRHHSGAGRHQRHRVRGRAGEGRLLASTPVSTSSLASAASPGTRILPAPPASSSSRRRRRSSPTPSCVSSSTTATAPTG